VKAELLQRKKELSSVSGLRLNQVLQGFLMISAKMMSYKPVLGLQFKYFKNLSHSNPNHLNIVWAYTKKTGEEVDLKQKQDTALSAKGKKLRDVRI